MPQIFQVLKCYKCSVFQVHQTKKLNKWICKVCGEKQSIKRHYGIGNGKECRLHVQKLNGIRGDINELKNQSQESINDNEMERKESVRKSNKIIQGAESKWSKYDNSQKEHLQPDLNETMYFNDMEVVLELPKKNSRKFITKSNTNKNVLEGNLKNNENQCNKEKYILDKFNRQNVMRSENIINAINFESKLSNTMLPIKGVEQNIHDNPLSPKTGKESKWSAFIDINSDNNRLSANYDGELPKYYKNDKIVSHSLCDDYNKSIHFQFHSDLSLCNQTKPLKGMDSKNKNVPESLMPSIVKEEYTQCNVMRDNTEIITYNNENLPTKINQSLFSLCDETDFDELLNI